MSTSRTHRQGAKRKYYPVVGLSYICAYCKNSFEPYNKTVRFCSIKCARRLQHNWSAKKILIEGDLAKIPLGYNRFAIVDASDAQMLSEYSWLHEKGYAITVANGKKLLMHRVLLGLQDRSVFVDHVNHNALDNRRSNLRPCTLGQNLANSKKRKGDCSSRYKGVTLDKRTKKWRAIISVDKARINLGSFDNEENAATAYDNAARDRFGRFARVNFPRDGEQPALI